MIQARYEWYEINDVSVQMDTQKHTYITWLEIVLQAIWKSLRFYFWGRTGTWWKLGDNKSGVFFSFQSFYLWIWDY